MFGDSISFENPSEWQHLQPFPYQKSFHPKKKEKIIVVIVLFSIVYKACFLGLCP